MSQIIERIKKEHAAILANLDQGRNNSLDRIALEECVRKAKTLLLAHVSEEDRDFYPRLRAAARTDNKLSRLLDFYAEDMAAITRAIIDFFERFDAGRIGDELPVEFNAIAGRLRDRMAREERTLHPEFKQRNLG